MDLSVGVQGETPLVHRRYHRSAAGKYAYAAETQLFIIASINQKYNAYIRKELERCGENIVEKNGGNKRGTNRVSAKRRMQALGLVYILLLTGIAVPKAEGAEKGGAACAAESLDVTEKAEDQKAEDQKAEDQKTERKKAEGGETAEAPCIALTFDDGPSTAYTPVLLDGLKERGVHATFFLIGKNIEQGDNADIVKRMYEEGHLIGNHTYSHVEITKLDDESAYKEISRTNELIEGITGARVEFMRPPFGSWQKELEARVQVIPVMWTVDPLDWATENVDEIVNKVVTEVEENDMILLHDCYDSSVKAALRIIDLLQAEGYRFVTADELITG